MSTVNFTLVPGAASETVNVNRIHHLSGYDFAGDRNHAGAGTGECCAHRDQRPGAADRLVQLPRAWRAGYGFNSHAINGGVTFENEVQFNGVPVAFVQFQGNQTNINPPYEAVNEFRVNTSTFNAQYGIGQGAVTFSLASGTNDFHGDAFEILRNQLFDSAGFFPTRFSPSGTPEPPINQQNDYGFTVGGPVWIPHVYNGKNRTFFHVSADWFRQNQA